MTAYSALAETVPIVNLIDACIVQDILNTLSVVASSLAGILFVLLVTLQNEQRYANKLLTPFVLTFGLALLQGQVEVGQQWYEQGYFRIICGSLFFLAGPSLYFYAKYLFKQAPLTRNQLHHIVPSLLSLVVGLIVHSDSVYLPDFWAWQQRTLYLQLAVYSVLVWNMVKQEQKVAVEEYSDHSHTQLNWVTALCISVMSLLAIDTLMGIAILMLHIEVPMTHNIMMSSIAIVIIGLTFHSLRQPLIIHGAS